MICAHLRDQLHITVLDTIVHHLDVVTSTLVTNPVTARLAVTLSSNALEDVLDVWPGLLVSTWHEGWAISGTLLTTRDTASDESDSLLGQILCSAVGIGEMRVTSINDNITLLYTSGKKSLDEIIDWLTSHDQKHYAAGFLELANELLNGVGTLDRLACKLTRNQQSSGLRDIQPMVLLTLGFIGEEVVNL